MARICEKQTGIKPMTDFMPILYKGLGLPVPQSGQRLAADHNELTRKVDGNTDSSGDGKIDTWDKNGRVEPSEIFEEIFSNRKKYQSVIKDLRAAGLEDPFEITPKIKRFVRRLLGKYGYRTELMKAKLLFRAVIPPGKSFKLKLGRMEFEGRGLSRSEGGLGVKRNEDPSHPLRKKFGNLLPKELMAAPEPRRVALCLEYSHLLVALLRAAGIKAHTKKEPDHAYVVAVLDKQKYRMDAARLVFAKEKNGANTDRESIAMHYSNQGAFMNRRGENEAAMRQIDLALNINSSSAHALFNKGKILADQKRSDESYIYFKKALAIKPEFAAALFDKPSAIWFVRGRKFYAEGKLDEALKCYKRAVEINPNFTLFVNDDIAMVWNDKGVLHYDQGEFEKALENFNKALEHSPHHAKVIFNMGNVFYQQGQLQDALRRFEMVLETNPDFASALNNRGVVLYELGRIDEAIASYDKALAIKPGFINALVNKGNLLRYLEKYEEALECYEKALQHKHDIVNGSMGNDVVLKKREGK
jgi:tetratricopeptide (TPR) repeat protein